MIKWIIAFLVLAVLSAFFGFGLIANLAFGIFRVLFWVFIALAVLSLIFGKRIFGSRDRTNYDDVRR